MTNSTDDAAATETGRPGLLRVEAPSDIPLARHVAEHRAELESALLRHGAVLLRGFAEADSDHLSEVVRAFSGEPLAYGERSSPRSEVSTGVYTSTDYPAQHAIQMHNESSYTNTWPLHLYFLCQQPPAEGGETPIADSRALLATLSDRTRELFRERGWMYVRNIGGGLGLSVRDVFQTEDTTEIEAYCRRNGIQVTRVDDDRLRLSARRDAIRTHPRSGAEVWFNHISFFNVFSMDEEIRTGLLELYGENFLPTHTYFGDGSPIPADVIAEILDAYRRNSIVFPWQRGDLLIVDNMLMSHGRRPYRGARQIRVSMAQPVHRDG